MYGRPLCGLRENARLTTVVSGKQKDDCAQQPQVEQLLNCCMGSRLTLLRMTAGRQ